jgi:hypothetical protein
MIRAEPVRTPGKFCGALMSTLEQHIAQIANLIAQLRELNQLRERVRKAELAGRSRRVGRRKRTLIRRLAPSLNRSGNHRSFSRTMKLPRRRFLQLAGGVAALPAFSRPRPVGCIIKFTNAGITCAAGCNSSRTAEHSNVSAGMIAAPALVCSIALPGERPSSVETNRPSRLHAKNRISATTIRSTLSANYCRPQPKLR